MSEEIPNLHTENKTHPFHSHSTDLIIPTVSIFQINVIIATITKARNLEIILDLSLTWPFIFHLSVPAMPSKHMVNLSMSLLPPLEFKLLSIAWATRIISLKKKKFFIYLTEPGLHCVMWTLSCGLWDLAPWTWIEPGPPALRMWSLIPWTSREVPAHKDSS